MKGIYKLIPLLFAGGLVVSLGQPLNAHGETAEAGSGAWRLAFSASGDTTAKTLATGDSFCVYLIVESSDLTRYITALYGETSFGFWNVRLAEFDVLVPNALDPSIPVFPDVPTDFFKEFRVSFHPDDCLEISAPIAVIRWTFVALNSTHRQLGFSNALELSPIHSDPEADACHAEDYVADQVSINSLCLLPGNVQVRTLSFGVLKGLVRRPGF